MSTEKPMLMTRPSFRGKKVYLRPLTAHDLDSIYLWQQLSEPQSLSCRSFGFASLEVVVEKFKKGQADSKVNRFAIIKRDDNTLIGSASYFDYNPLNRSAEMGVLIDPDEHQNGYASEAIKLVMHYLFSYLGLNKVYAQTAEFNSGAIKLLESLRFKKDATLRDHYFYKDEFHAGLIYSLLRFELD